MADYIDSLIQNLEERRQNVIDGHINGIPFAIPSMRRIIPTTEQSSYILITGQSKSGKSQLCNYLYLYNSVLFAYNNPKEIRLHVIMFPLEEGKDMTIYRFICYLLYLKYKVRISPLNLRSSNPESPLPAEILKLIKGEDIQNVLKFFSKTVQFESATNNIDIDKAVTNYANSHGVQVKSEETFLNKQKEITHKNAEYVPDDPDEYVMVIIDHMNLLEPTKSDNYDIIPAISNMSKKLVKYYRNYRYICIAVQQQVDGETSSLSAIKADNILPTKPGLKDCKSTGQDKRTCIYMYFYNLLVKMFGYVDNYSYICNKLNLI